MERKSIYILYVGSDSAYWSGIKDRFKRDYGDMSLEFGEINHGSAIKNFIGVLDDLPSIIYLDLSVDQSEQIQVSTFLKREKLTADIPIIGLVDKKEKARSCVSAGVQVVHVKCGEHFDVVYDAIYLKSEPNSKMGDFAIAKLKENIKIYEDFRVGYYTPTSVHIECNNVFYVNDEIEIDLDSPDNLIQSKKFTVEKRSETNLYYDYKFSYDLEINFLDRPGVDDALTEELIANAPTPEERERLIALEKEKRKDDFAEYEENYRRAKKKMAKWVTENQLDSSSKGTKILFIDRTLNVVRNLEKPLNSFPFSIRLQTSLDEDLTVVRKISPQIIAYQAPRFVEDQIEGIDPAEVRKLKAETEARVRYEVKQIIDYAKSDETEVKPIIVIFNCDIFTTQTLKESYMYPMCIVREDNISFEVAEQMAIMYEKKETEKREKFLQKKVQELIKKNPTKFRNLRVSDLQEKKFFLKHTSAMSFASISKDVVLRQLTESTVFIEVPYEISLQSYRFVYPIDMHVLIVASSGKPYIKEGKNYIYKGLIHSVDEEDKKEIRRFINEVFTSGKIEAEAEEAEAFKKLNEEVLQAKLEKEDSDSESKEGKNAENTDVSDDSKEK